jgi:hypothetical protein
MTEVGMCLTFWREIRIARRYRAANTLSALHRRV